MVSHWEVEIHEKLTLTKIIVNNAFTLSRSPQCNVSPKGSGTHVWWWRGLWLWSRQASTITSPAPRRWNGNWMKVKLVKCSDVYLWQTSIHYILQREKVKRPEGTPARCRWPMVPILLVLYNMMILYRFNTMVTRNSGELCFIISLVARFNRSWQNRASSKSSSETSHK